jgi:hypothetical protein
MVTFSERLQLAKIFGKEVEENNKNNSFKLDTDPLTFLGWLESNDLLDAQNCRRCIAGAKLDECLKHFNRRKDCT